MKSPAPLFKNTSGLTLLEVSVVILSILTLIAVLFVGAQAYKRGADRSTCLLNIRNVQMAVRHFQNTNQLNIGDNLPASSIYEESDGAYLYTPTCPGAGSYTMSATVPDYGTPALTCSLAGSSILLHVPKDTNGW